MVPGVSSLLMVTNSCRMERPLQPAQPWPQLCTCIQMFTGGILGCAMLAGLRWEAEEGWWPVASQSLGMVTELILFWKGHKTKAV